MKKKLILVLLLITIICFFVMLKVKNISPKFKIPVAEKELELRMGQTPMGRRGGGLSLFSTKFKRGYGNAVFGSDENGIWLGGAEFPDAPFNVGMDGAMNAKSATFKDQNGTTIVDASGLVSTTQFTSDNHHETSEWFGGGTLGTNAYDVSGYDYVTDAELTFTLTRTTKVLFLLNALLQQALDSTSNGIKTGYVALILNDTTVLAYGQISEKGNSSKTISDAQMIGIHAMETLSEGDHTIKIGISTADPSNYETYIYERSLSYLILGK